MVNKMNGESVDLTAQNIARLKELFPEVLTDGEKIDFDMLKAVLGGEVDSENERYQFTWHGKKKMIAGTQKPSKGTLRPVPEKSKNFDTTENLYIEGDNLEVLKLLQKSYNGKIKMIYIDPPYNTGKDFVYKDNFKDGVQNYLQQTGQVDSEGNILSTNVESNGRFHTDWLNMMYARLKLSKTLLSEDGIIFLSIDDAEQERLKFICNEIFGEKNFVACLPTVMNLKGNNDQFGFAGTHEYTLVYLKNKNALEDLNGLPLQEDDMQDYTFEDEKGKYKKGATLMRTGEAGGREKRPKGFYPIFVSVDYKRMSIERLAETDIEVYPKTKDGKEMSWRRSKETLANSINEFIITKTKDGIAFNKKQRLADDIERGKKAKTLFYKPSYSSGNGTNILQELLGERYFDNPKPLELIKDFLTIGMKDGIVLDFFSGSATTAHATMQLNAEDGGNRKFIMVQLPEPLDEKSAAYKEGYRTICDIGEERIRRAGDKIKEELIEKQKQLGMLAENTIDHESLDFGFKVLNLDKSNIREWNVNFADLEDKLDLYNTPFVEDRSELDVVYEIMLKQGLELTYPIEIFEVNGETVYDIAFGSLFICLSQKITLDVAQAIIARRDEQGTDTSSVIFSDAGFATDSDKLNCIEILKDAGYPEDNLLTL